MVKLNKIYTRTGDKGETSLVNGYRVSKHSLRPAAFGSVDEVNSVLGVCRLHTGALADPEPDAMLARIQNDLFDLGLIWRHLKPISPSGLNCASPQVRSNDWKPRLTP